MKLCLFVALISLFSLQSILATQAAGDDEDMPLPWTRMLYVTDPEMTGSDVYIMQSLLLRDNNIDSSLAANSVYDDVTEENVLLFQDAYGLEADGIFGPETAQLLLDLHSDDGIRFDTTSAGEMGYLYKMSIGVVANRSVETIGKLFDADNKFLMDFKVRTHGWTVDDESKPWPDYTNDVGLNQFTSNGNTPTGWMTIDLNSPEPDPETYGPYPINRIVEGFEGNAAILLPNIRDGLLMHTGEWPDWDDSMQMPNSEGCIHVHPDDCEKIEQTLQSIGVEVRDNPYTGKDYPYEPQGVLLVHLLTEDEPLYRL